MYLASFGVLLSKSDKGRWGKKIENVGKGMIIIIDYEN